MVTVVVLIAVVFTVAWSMLVVECGADMVTVGRS